MREKPAVSVVMPIYNAERYLRTSIESVRSQTLGNIEIVCVNDGSTDGSYDLLMQYAQLDSRIRILDGPNGGYGKAMNTGIAAAEGDYIGIVEPDDYIKPTMYERLYRAAAENHLDFIRSDYYKLSTTRDGTEHLELTRISPRSSYYNVVSNPQKDYRLFNVLMENWTGIYRTDWIKSNCIRFNESPGASFQDNGFWFQTYCLAERISLCDEAFYCYRIDNAASSINQKDKAFAMLDEYAWIERWLRSRPDDFKRLSGVFHYEKSRNCMFAFERLGEQFQLPYLERYAQEYRDAFRREEVDEKLFWPNELAQLKEVMADPVGYVDAYRAGRDPKSLMEHARERGRGALFAFYVREEGLISAIQHFLGFMSRR